MDLTTKYYDEKYSDPVEFLNQLRQTTEPIGGGIEYDEEGELVEYEVALIALDKCKANFIAKAVSWLEQQEELVGISFTNDFLERFKKAMNE